MNSNHKKLHELKTNFYQQNFIENESVEDNFFKFKESSFYC